MTIDNPNDPVSNHDPAGDEIEESDSVGAGGETDAPGDDGLEQAAEGFALRTGGGAAAEMAAAPVAPSTDGLRSAVEASYTEAVGLITAESVIGDDNRTRINGTDRYPWRAHASLLVTARDGSRWIGTAFFISPRVLATAGHNLFFHGPVEARRGWARGIVVMPGRNEGALPFGQATSTRFFSVRGWTESPPDNPDAEYDYGVIVLDEGDDLGSRTGWLGFANYGDSTLRSVVGNLAGYPGDLGQGAQQWYMARRINSVSGRQIFYDIDTAGGQSGSAVYRIRDGSRYAVGIHAYGVGVRPFNAATRINGPVFDNLQAWKSAHQ
jgi:V8-like Glu-specific endopeptidase